jgi:alpha-amylase/alpha-mannosidase (GH57 family)
VSERYLCIHGHFYQPPRENPWLDAVEVQDSAAPYHDWNERITAECYGPNGLSRVLDEKERIVEIVNNYSKISFNFGPTLLSWMEAKAPEAYAAVLEADRASRERFSGHGSALAQAYNHMILPLANARDRETQVIWGIRDFERRFGRKPEGMWLPETAADTASLETLAEHGILFTLLAPSQARRFRAVGGRNWHDTPDGSVDPSRTYEVRLPSGRKIAVFFYDGPISRAVAFERLLNSGEAFARRLVGGLSDARTWPQLSHIATDGESYGHHHRFGDMALAYALRFIEAQRLARLTNYGEFLEKNPPKQVVEIHENTSWSCAHGVERWRSDCGCSSGAHAGWRQAWRAPLREALDWLRDQLASAFEAKARLYLKDPWAARNAYIDVVLDRSTASLEAFLAAHALRPLDPAERTTVLKLLGVQRNAQLMYTSCGWFFDDISGLETAQVLLYAGRAIQVAGEALGLSLEEPFLERIARAPSNLPERGDGRKVYQRAMRAAAADPLRIGAHYAIASLFREDGEDGKVYSYSVTPEEQRVLEAGTARLAMGRARVAFTLTGEEHRLEFAVLHQGEHNLTAGVARDRGEERHAAMLTELTQAFEAGDLNELQRLIDKHFDGQLYSLSSLLRDEQRRILRRVLESSLAEARDEYRRLYQRAQPMMRFLTGLRIPLPKAYQVAAELVLNHELRKGFEAPELDLVQIRKLLDKVKQEGVRLDGESLGFALTETLTALARKSFAEPLALPKLTQLAQAVALARTLPFEVNLWRAQNGFYQLARRLSPGLRERVTSGDATATGWVGVFEALGESLGVRVA